MKIVIYCLIIVFLAALAYVRLSPMVVDRWHVDPFEIDPPKEGGVLQRFSSQMGAIATLEAYKTAALATPRTVVLAGSPSEGRMSFVTRTALWGFPDVTTIAVRETADSVDVAIFARLRFGKSDLGVNGKRVTAWRAKVEQAQ
ncbi:MULTISPECIES: DUF1499 domain-containing protein [Pacificibacter]|uniref:DUF1499 domain-containing protein n=1 Tax=Pacificibacter TaxID=1042323 RepID=UPI001C09B9C9|nr:MULTISPECIES: DUF1499 domain-containing protein [Pacificibacter]MBU2936938.1 DUF1499 domain-containing protein [Pacificibacter marinus]MDO6614932.1 DUF1499 domain-containing protein [Pacificibacter sp. 1_MG-2023]